MLSILDYAYFWSSCNLGKFCFPRVSGCMKSQNIVLSPILVYPTKFYYLLLSLKMHFYFNSSKILLKHAALLELLEITLTSQNLYSGQYFPPAPNTYQKPHSAAEGFRGFCDSYSLPHDSLPHCTGFKAVLLEQSVNFLLPLIIVQISSCCLSSKASKILCCTNLIQYKTASTDSETRDSHFGHVPLLYIKWISKWWIEGKWRVLSLQRLLILFFSIWKLLADRIKSSKLIHFLFFFFFLLPATHQSCKIKEWISSVCPIKSCLQIISHYLLRNNDDLWLFWDVL